ncbi:response regulator [Siphonobacter sp. SORGH_AS_1065]|uniref:response regulator n=1 Tax=Siphonobacter sp. SORGH_AS_1065 TaxID=3041795 RepID=UPI002785AE1B|nr:response regulator [Siphonobacter sp. SORGH_AS_1065]MDQ1088712.1 signal transduction histidine kinase/DNA-binding response OmpR family regulator/CHASE3 domain sensor protein [Siphonobacter sp. SORGH_AS_1065]
MPRAHYSVIKQLQVVFSISVILLVFSLVASFYSTQRLITNSELVNHTNEVLLESENIMSHLKDAETGQRGYLITLDPDFLQPYTGAYDKANRSYNTLKNLTIDNKVQQKNLDEAKRLYDAKFNQMQLIIDLVRRKGMAVSRDTARQNDEMIKGKKIMDNLRSVIEQIKKEENNILQSRLEKQSFYITYTPIVLAIAAIVSILITGFSYTRIKNELDTKLKEQIKREEAFEEANRRISVMEGITGRIAQGDYTSRSQDTRDDELGRIGRALNAMVESLEMSFNDLERRNWLQTGSAEINNAINGERNARKLASNLINTLTHFIGVPVGTVYFMESDLSYKLISSYASSTAPEVVYIEKGLVGQAIKEKQIMLVNDLPDNYLVVESSLGQTPISSLVIMPLVYANMCIGVIELGFLRSPNELELELLKSNADDIAVGVNAALDYIKLQNFLEETQAQAEELQAQHNELENLNAELEAQSQKLQASEEELRVQQEELLQSNTELEERSLLLEEKNEEIQRKAEELEISTRYKSEFLANMSHELRTPLNSILLLSRLLAENNENHLSKDEVEYAQVINNSGNGLLGLIDEILDLSKIEAGQMKLEFMNVSTNEITDELKALFTPLAKDKKLDFKVKVADTIPAYLETDRLRLGQILKNLLSNAIKFTSEGEVSLTLEKDTKYDNSVRFIVRDTGIGIPKEKQHLIFEAFQQADGSTKRKYGGTGLGLSISRELVKLLGGELVVTSEVNKGSEFTLHLPISKLNRIEIEEIEVTPVIIKKEEEKPQPAKEKTTEFLSTTIPANIPDDRQSIERDDKVILIIEDDTAFAKSLLDYSRKKGYKGIVSVRGDEGLKLAGLYKPAGILLDIQLPIMSGWEVMDALKADPQTRPIPVHIMSSHKMKTESLLKGAVDFVNKPMAFEQMKDVFEKIEYVLNRNAKKVLIIEDNPKHAKALAYFLETFNINSELKSDVDQGIQALRRKDIDCVILDMGIPDSKAYDMLEQARKDPDFENLPIIIFTGKSLSLSEELKIKKYADSIIVKTAHSYQRMLDEVSLFLHLVEDNKQSEKKEGRYKKLGELSQILKGKNVLVADDDIRNIFSLSKALENYQMNVITALDGKEALQKLEENAHIDIVLLDMMMPQMDGYETARKIRENYLWKDMPVIAVTAKAMTGDREKCIQAGASDYITKPVDIDQLLSLLRVWLYERS